MKIIIVKIRISITNKLNKTVFEGFSPSNSSVRTILSWLYSFTACINRLKSYIISSERWLFALQINKYFNSGDLKILLRQSITIYYLFLIYVIQNLNKDTKIQMKSQYSDYTSNNCLLKQIIGVYYLMYFQMTYFVEISLRYFSPRWLYDILRMPGVKLIFFFYIFVSRPVGCEKHDRPGTKTKHRKHKFTTKNIQ